MSQPPGSPRRCTLQCGRGQEEDRSVRVYLPTTLSALRRLAEERQVVPSDEPLIAYAVTPALRGDLEETGEGDLEELEYAAFANAARASLRLLQADVLAPRRRVVLAADVPDTAGQPVQIGLPPGAERAAVRLSTPVPLASVAAVHVDDAGAEHDVRAAAAAVRAADAGDEDARSAVSLAEGHELLWFTTQEIGDLLV